MGNCSFRGQTDAARGSSNFIRIMRDSGEILELKGPKMVGDILIAFPGYRIFSKGQISAPLFHDDELVDGHLYYLFPSREEKQTCTKEDTFTESMKNNNIREPTVRLSSSAALEELVTRLSNGSGLEVLPSPRNGVWRVKLAINSKQLGEILSEEVNTEALIEQMSRAANSTTITPRRAKGSWGSNWRSTNHKCILISQQ